MKAKGFKKGEKFDLKKYAEFSAEDWMAIRMGKSEINEQISRDEWSIRATKAAVDSRFEAGKIMTAMTCHRVLKTVRSMAVKQKDSTW